jgi:hypothetical protein
MTQNDTAKREPRLGIDIGRVIIDGSAHPAGGDTAFFEGDETTMLATPEMAGAFDAIAQLHELFGGRVWLVSKCGARVQARTLRWLDGHDFYGRTGVSRDNVRFCRIRAEKRGHCEELGLTHFVDDRTDVHAAIHGTVEYQYLFGQAIGSEHAQAATTWADVLRLIAATIASHATMEA